MDLCARSEAAKYELAFKSKDEEITFLRGHLSQLSEKLPKALPPSEDEAKRKACGGFGNEDGSKK